ncbi:MAG TPA: choice-of-anchor tandem repeat GloVer-containing protein [Terriglobia bacterium]|nr:choice-of-anchor tandem repeat GloVer-containing protein [Terriglobia bacterium]
MKNAKRLLACATCILALLAGLVATPSAQAQTFTTLFSFDYTPVGAQPFATLVQANDGNLYGTTTTGGANLYYGTVFKITPGGTLTTLHSFDFTDGYYRYGVLVQATDGNFYDTTQEGGATGNGTVFKISPSGNLATLYSFCAQSGCADGSLPHAGLIQATDGNFYGTTFSGGANSYGTVFKIAPSGTLTTLYSFCSQSGCGDGSLPSAGLIQAVDGNFYGTTSSGGANRYYGTVFRITASGTLTTLYSFCSQTNCADGAGPSGLVQAADGNLYGTTSGGGGSGISAGTVFKITPSGALTKLYSFCSQSGCTDGNFPAATLVQATDGNFYGTTDIGGVGGSYGTVFKVTPRGILTTLHRFDSTDGANPYAGLVQDTNGNFYGTTLSGGASSTCTGGCGTVFSLSAGLGPFVETQPTFGRAGKTVKILGTNLTGSTSVSFNGTAATFTVLSSSLITTTVPVGATTGTVQVVTPHGTLSSNVPFRVLP